MLPNIPSQHGNIGAISGQYWLQHWGNIEFQYRGNIVSANGGNIGAILDSKLDPMFIQCQSKHRFNISFQLDVGSNADPMQIQCCSKLDLYWIYIGFGLEGKVILTVILYLSNADPMLIQCKSNANPMLLCIAFTLD